MTSRTAKLLDASDRDDLTAFLRKANDGWYSSLTLQMLTGIPSERCYRALRGAPGIECRNGGAMTQFRFAGDK